MILTTNSQISEITSFTELRSWNKKSEKPTKKTIIDKIWRIFFALLNQLL